MQKYLVLLFIILFISCGKSVEESDDGFELEEAPPDGIYSAVLIPINGRVSTTVHGEAKIEKFADDFIVNVEVKGAPSGSFRQHLHTGSSCPRLEHDENGDGYVDAYEAHKITGKIIVPFDNDLSSQYLGYNTTLQGNYSYSRSTSYGLMLSDLHLSDDIINDSMVKLREKDLRLERKVVMVYKLNNREAPTVKGDIPIACGVLTRVSNRTERDEWGGRRPDPPSESPGPRRPRRSPRSDPDPDWQPRPDPAPAPAPGPENEDSGWWSRWRSRWERWRDRVDDWWNEGDGQT